MEVGKVTKVVCSFNIQWNLLNTSFGHHFVSLFSWFFSCHCASNSFNCELFSIICPLDYPPLQFVQLFVLSSTFAQRFSYTDHFPCKTNCVSQRNGLEIIVSACKRAHQQKGTITVQVGVTASGQSPLLCTGVSPPRMMVNQVRCSGCEI